MKVGIDIMGGDFAPVEAIKGTLIAFKSLPEDCTVVMIGDEAVIREELINQGADPSDFEIIHASQVVEMGDHPTKILVQKPDSSIAVGYKLLAKGEIDSFASAGNTGAMLVAAIYSIKAIPGVIRPTISSVLPKKDGSFGIILDVGANSDCKPDILYQFGILGSLYAKHIYKIEDPKVGLLNIGEEETKGNLLTTATFQLMKDTDQFNFVGNVEGRDLFTDKTDLVVCDGFTGNIILKTAESIYQMVKERGIDDEYFNRFNFEDYGGTPILGINAPVVIGHGISNAKTFNNMILLSKDLVESNLIGIFKDVFN